MATTAPTATRNGPQIGLLEWFWYEDYEAVEQAVADIRTLGVRHLRIAISWADYHRENGPAWFDWLLPKLAAEVELLPCFVYTPPSIGEVPSCNAPPRDLATYAQFVDLCIDRYGQYFDHVELWNEPNNLREWNFTLDWSWRKFAAMVRGAAHWARERGKRTVLGGMSPVDPNWLDTMFELGVMEHIDVVGIHGFPGSYDVTPTGWGDHLARVQAVLDRHGSKAKIWITEAGYPTWQFDEYEQVRVFSDVLEQPVERAYWLCLYDLPSHRPSSAGFHADPRDYHFGLKTETRREKLLYRLWASQGLDGVRAAARWADPVRRHRNRDVALVTGGAGFVGANLVDRLVREGRHVRIVDNLSRPGVERNLAWLRERHPRHLEFVPADLRNRYALADTLEGVDQVFHLAAQVAVTTSLDDPMADFRINLEGTLNLLEAARRQPTPPGIVFSSTNKVYGGLPDLPLERDGQRYLPVDPAIRAHGIGESRNLDFHSPYGCSKGGADQYLIDYARCMGVPAVVLRMSCIYGPRQFGTEDQGWVAHFLIRALQDQAITLYGDGCQARDILYVDDLVNAFLLAQDHMDQLSGRAFNLGGGPANTVSLLDLIDLIERLHGHRPELHFADWRPGDQRYYCSDTRAFQTATGWQPQVDAAAGVARLYEWLSDSYVIQQPQRRRRIA